MKNFFKTIIVILLIGVGCVWLMGTGKPKLTGTYKTDVIKGKEIIITKYF